MLRLGQEKLEIRAELAGLETAPEQGACFSNMFMLRCYVIKMEGKTSVETKYDT